MAAFCDSDDGDYERQRRRRIEENNEVLKSLGLGPGATTTAQLFNDDVPPPTRPPRQQQQQQEKTTKAPATETLVRSLTETRVSFVWDNAAVSPAADSIDDGEQEQSASRSRKKPRIPAASSDAKAPADTRRNPVLGIASQAVPIFSGMDYSMMLHQGGKERRVSFLPVINVEQVLAQRAEARVQISCEFRQTPLCDPPKEVDPDFKRVKCGVNIGRLAKRNAADGCWYLAREHGGQICEDPGHRVGEEALQSLIVGDWCHVVVPDNVVAGKQVAMLVTDPQIPPDGPLRLEAVDLHSQPPGTVMAHTFVDPKVLYDLDRKSHAGKSQNGGNSFTSGDLTRWMLIAQGAYTRHSPHFDTKNGSLTLTEFMCGFHRDSGTYHLLMPDGTLNRLPIPLEGVGDPRHGHFKLRYYGLEPIIQRFTSNVRKDTGTYECPMDFHLRVKSIAHAAHYAAAATGCNIMEKGQPNVLTAINREFPYIDDPNNNPQANFELPLRIDWEQCKAGAWRRPVWCRFGIPNDPDVGMDEEGEGLKVFDPTVGGQVVLFRTRDGRVHVRLAIDLALKLLQGRGPSSTLRLYGSPHYNDLTSCNHTTNNFEYSLFEKFSTLGLQQGQECVFEKPVREDDNQQIRNQSTLQGGGGGMKVNWNSEKTPKAWPAHVKITHYDSVTDVCTGSCTDGGGDVCQVQFVNDKRNPDEIYEKLSKKSWCLLSKTAHKDTFIPKANNCDGKYFIKTTWQMHCIREMGGTVDTRRFFKIKEEKEPQPVAAAAAASIGVFGGRGEDDFMMIPMTPHHGGAAAAAASPAHNDLLFANSNDEGGMMVPWPDDDGMIWDDFEIP